MPAWPLGAPFVFRSLRQKLFAGVLLTSLIGLLIAAAGLFLHDLTSYRESSAASLATEARILGYVTSAALQFEDPASAAMNLSFLSARPTVRAAAVYSESGKRFATYVRPGVPLGELPALAALDHTVVDGDRIAVFRQVTSGKDRIGTVYLSEDLGLAKRISAYAVIAFAVMVAALLVCAILSAWLQRSLTRPVIEISRLAHEIVDTRDYSLRARRDTQDEIGTLVDAFNEMLSEIQRRTTAMEASSGEVTRLNRDLERRVGARTSELEDSNLQLRSANLAKSNFLSMMSHEIRTPMNGVLGMLELLSLGDLEPSQRTTLEIVRDSSRSLLRIIDDILDFSKIEAGKLEVRGEVSSIAHIVANVVAVYSGNASSKALVLKSKVDPRLSPAVTVDPLRLQQILNNLVSNAIKFTSKGSVEIEARLLGRKPGEDLVRLSVTDTGMGISPEQKAKLFQPFAQADGVTRVFGGTGLGLSIGQRLAALMGGAIEIHSEPGLGTTVSLVLPLPVAEAHLLPAPGRSVASEALGTTIEARRTAPSVEEAEREGTLVLVVDDHPINRMLLMRQVTLLGYAAIAANDGREALEKWREGRFGLVITDCNMPEMDGYELSRAIRAEEETTGRRRTLIIACTANALKGEAQNCFEAGMDDYLAKPVELGRLLSKLTLWLPLGAVQSPAEEARPTPPEPAEGDAPIIDARLLAKISGGDADAEREILSQFIPYHRDDVASLSKAFDAADMASIVHLAHRIKGSSSAIGAVSLAGVCEFIERAARAKDWSAVVERQDTFRREAGRLESYLEGCLRS